MGSDELINKPVATGGDKDPAMKVFSNGRMIFEKAEFSIRAEFNNLPQGYDANKRFMLIFLATLFHRISTSPDLFDSRCLFNIEHVGRKFVDLADRISTGDFTHLESTFALSYRFLIEFQIMTPGGISSDLEGILDQAVDFEFGGSVTSTIRYAEHQMAVRIINRYVHHPDMVKLKDLPAVIRKSEKEREKSEELLTSREERVEELKNKLDTYKTAFNFVGLNQGFKNLRFQKRIEAGVGLFWLFILGCVMMSPPIYKICSVLMDKPLIKIDLYLALTILGFELLLAYFFRVALHGYRAVKAQLIQIDLRMALCQFIQDYADYAKEIRRDSPELLDKFDQLVFSGIVNNESAIPSTFDGLDSLASLIDKVRAK